ncbi:ACP S-malonyltransferase [Pajaroellobacter abortibovis]|uniref:Malonyl CoA-acyl carrier protein transacylase n=1 Tax=Pajaroellobacter abortibovis TaxID=1882918 RepID=A0A1L6MXP7_9BACT|nr:ACP S-malonyltransferase [Pajaroellobacter abortibovis]APS00267.1 [acyl-carrier-protein] S-malonyltransferase [Pajaroellobacter abortibovis]
MSIAWLFPGQGSQFPGMGRDLFEASHAAREIFKRADEALKQPLSELIFNGPEEELMLTSNAQPAIVTMSAAVLAALLERYHHPPLPSVAAGHSLGEYSALFAAQSVSFEDAVRLVRIRGEAMQKAVPVGVGSMIAALGLANDLLIELCKQASEGNETVSPANFNAPGQVVLAGYLPALERVQKLIQAAGGKVTPLKVSAPFHCPLMTPAAVKLKRALAEVPFQKPSFPVIANVDVQPHEEHDSIQARLIRQIDHPVQWEETIRLIESKGIQIALEIGPGKVLAGLVKRISPSISTFSLGDLQSFKKVDTLMEKYRVEYNPHEKLSS